MRAVPGCDDGADSIGLIARFRRHFADSIGQPNDPIGVGQNVPLIW